MIDGAHPVVQDRRQRRAFRPRVRLRDEAGQTAAEYLGVIVLIAAILAAIASTGIGGKLTDLIEDAIDKVFQNQN